jgi:hypothetical protein
MDTGPGRPTALGRLAPWQFFDFRTFFLLGHANLVKLLQVQPIFRIRAEPMAEPAFARCSPGGTGLFVMKASTQEPNLWAIMRYVKRNEGFT